MTIIYALEEALPPFKAYAIQVINTCYELAKKGCNVYLLVPKSKEFSIEIEKYYGLPALDNFKVIELPQMRLDADSVIRFSWKKVYFISILAKIWRISKRSKPSVLILRDLQLAEFLLKFKKYLKLRFIYEADDAVNFLIKRKSILNAGGDLSLKANKNKILSLKKREAGVYNNVDAIICVTERLRKVLQTVFKPKIPVKTIPNGIRLAEKIPSAYSYHKDMKNIFYIGHLYNYKGISTLIDAMCYLKKNPVKLFIVGGIKGTPQYTNLDNLIKQQGLEDKIGLIDFIPPGQLKNMDWRIDLLVMPLLGNRLVSKHFASTLKLFDYMSMRRPMVVSELPSIKEVLTNRVNTVLVEPGNTKALAEGIQLILDDIKLAQKISEQAFKDIHKYLWETRAQRILDIARELSNKSK